jgi:hypothetical protein
MKTNNTWGMITFLTALICITSMCFASEDKTDERYFLSKAKKILPVEKQYDYHRTLKKGPIHRLRRDPAIQETPKEISISDDGWKVLVHTKAGSVVQYASKDMREYLKTSMQVTVKVETRPSLKNWAELKQVIVAGTPDQLPGMGLALKGQKDYEIRVTPQKIIVCGFDERGVMYGLFNLEARMSLREGPFLPRDLKTVRHSRFQTRMVLSWLGWMQWPDSFLSHLAHDGYDAIYASVYANPNGVEGPPHYHLIRKQNAAKLHDLIRRAKRHGIKVYTPILYANTREPENKAKLREHVRDIVTKFPGIHGYILLTEGFYYEKFFGAGGHGKQDLRDWAKHWTEAVNIVAEECHKINPKIEILPWEYNIDFRPTRVELKRYVTSLIPQNTIPLLTWENGKAFEIDGLHGYLRDYSISQVGPAEVSAAQIVEAKRRNMTVYCKVDCFATWQFGTTPYLPCPQQWQRRYDALASHGIDGTLESWSNGYKPNFIAELRGWSCWTNPLDQQTLLKSIARREFGAGSEGQVIKSWEHFSKAIQYVPDTGPSMGTNNAVANPLFFEEPPPRIMMLKNSWWDEKQKSHWRHRMNPFWPYAHPIMIFTPDFTNRTNRAEQYARARSGIGAIESKERLKTTAVLPVFNKYVLLAANELEKGLMLYRQAALNAPESKQKNAFKEVLIVEQMQRMLRSLHAILEFEDLRFRMVKMKDPIKAKQLINRMSEILKAEIERTKASLETARRDSRLGYECEMDYVYTPYVLNEKLRLLRETLEQQIPDYQKNRNQ